MSECVIKEYTSVIVTTDPVFADRCSEEIIYINNETAHLHLRRGDKLYIDNGAIALQVEWIQERFIHCLVLQGAILNSRRVVNIPGVALEKDCLAESDRLDIDFCIEHQVDAISVAYVNSARTITRIRSILEESAKNIKIIATIEDQIGVDHFDEILKVSDGKISI